MEHFVSIITTDYKLEDHLVESVLTSANAGLLETETLYETFETDNGEQVLRVQLTRQLSESEADSFAESLADKLFEMGYENFDIEVSTDEDSLPFDIVEDLFVFMTNDPMFYRKTYYPAIVKISDAVHNKKKINFANLIQPVIEKAVDEYVSKFALPKSTKKMFKDEDRSNLIARIKQEEMENIQQGEY